MHSEKEFPMQGSNGQPTGWTPTARRFSAKIRKAWVLIFAFALLAGACGEDADADLSGSIGFIKGPHSAMEVTFEEQIIADFNADVAPDVDVSFSTYDWPVHVAELTTLFASGSPPDVQYLVDLIYPSFAEQGVLQDMTELVNDPEWADERASISPFAWDLAQQDGGTWGVPVLGAVYNIFINETLLEEAGVLDTWDDSYASMLAAAQATTTENVFGFAARTNAGDFAWWDWYPYMHNAGGDVLSEDWSECGLVGQDVVDAMQFLIDIHTAGVTPPIGSIDNQGLFDLFAGGKIAILHHETPNIVALNENPPDFDWTVAAPPPGASGTDGDGQLRHLEYRPSKRQQRSGLGVHQALGLGPSGWTIRGASEPAGCTYRYSRRPVRRQRSDADRAD